MVGLVKKPARISLWAGWSIELPVSHYQRNEDGSWSAWGQDWTVDIHVIEISGDNRGMPVSGERIVGQADHGKPILGSGWTGTTELRVESDNGRDVYRLAGRLGAENTLMLCWVSYVREEQSVFAQELIGAVVHE